MVARVLDMAASSKPSRGPLARPLPDDVGKTLQRSDRSPGIGPLRRLLEADVVARFAARAAVEQGARHIDHLWCANPLIGDRRAALPAEAAHGAALGLLEP